MGKATLLSIVDDILGHYAGPVANVGAVRGPTEETGRRPV